MNAGQLTKMMFLFQKQKRLVLERSEMIVYYIRRNYAHGTYNEKQYGSKNQNFNAQIKWFATVCENVRMRHTQLFGYSCYRLNFYCLNVLRLKAYESNTHAVKSMKNLLATIVSNLVLPVY